MFIPTSGNNEFIEIYNQSSSPVDLTNFKIKYETSAPDIIISAGAGLILQPLSYAVILEGDYDFAGGIYSNLIPPSALILKITDNAFGSSGMANTADRNIYLLNSLNDTLQAYLYSANNGTAISDEKINLTANNSSANWGNSVSLNGTPGFTNSITPVNFDLSLASLSVSPAIPFHGDNLFLSASVKNLGVNSASSYTINFYNDLNFDSLGTMPELISSQQFSNLAPGDSITASAQILNAQAGSYQFIAEVIFNDDENLLNNKKIKAVTVYPPGNNYNDAVVNEIMYAPSAGEPEWIELYNRTSSPISLKKWAVSDLSSSAVITSLDKFIPPNSFIILSRDSSVVNFYSIPVEVISFNLPQLNNSGDAVVIKDSLGVLIDSVSFLSSWGGSSGKSLERISPDDVSTLQSNWGTSQSINKATPGRINSLTPKENDLKIASFKPQNNFAVIGENALLKLTVKNAGTNSSSNYEISFYSDINADSIPQPSELFFNSSFPSLQSGDSSIHQATASNITLGSNYFIAVVDAEIDDDSSNNIAFTKVIGAEINELRNDLVINEFMYAPISPEPEWIEIFNRSSKTIDMKNYFIADAADTQKVISQSLILLPGEYLVISLDSLLLTYYTIPSKFVKASLPTLNNSGDKIILLDSLKRVIDSLQYFSTWGGAGGRSLERISADHSSTDSSNWKTSSNKNKATPGRINSVSPKEFDIQASSILFSPAYPLFGDDVSVSAQIKNLGSSDAVFNLFLFEDTDLDSIPDLQIAQADNQFIAAGDSIIILFNYNVPALQSKKGFYIRADFISDEDTSNNNFYKIISPGYPAGTILINEIMYQPANGEPEWIEIYNTSDVAINLNGWRLGDVLSTPTSAKINFDVFIEPLSYLLVTKDSSVFDFHRLIPSPVIKLSFPNLNNDADGVVIKDDRGLTVDSLLFQSSWGGAGGYSLERISLEAPSVLPANWGSSVDIEQSTPGRINSITPKQNDLLLSEVKFNPLYPVEGDNVFINAKVKNNGALTAQSFSIEFYIDSDDDNSADSLLSRINNLSLAADDSLTVLSSSSIQNLTQKTVTAVRVVYTEDEDTLNNYVEKAVEPGFPQRSVLINEIMHSPLQGEPEWVEVINVSPDSINLINWLISDILPSPKKNFITNTDLFLAPNEFLILSKDSSFFTFYPDVNVKFAAVDFGALSNTSDGVIIYDFRDAIIDSVAYKSSWGGRNGYSLERISLSKAAQDSSNWTTSLSLSKSTPGAPNSIFNIPPYQRNSLIINEIMFDPAAVNTEFIEFYNPSDEEIYLGGWRIEDENGRFHKFSETNFILSPKSYFIFAADSSIFDNYSFNNANIITAGSSTLGLSNSGELILLKDVRGNIIDSIWYSDKWHNKNFISTKNISLERINPSLNGNDNRNWSSSVSPNCATPGGINSIFSENNNFTSGITVSPNPFSPDNDGFEDFTIINYSLSQITSQVRIKIYDSRGRIVRTLLNNHPVGQRGSVIFDGLDESGGALRIGIYIIFLEALNDNSGAVENLKATIVVARKL